ncbi:hypothetical protein [Niallia endozanthoxylica]|uniref:2TM domain-containing protein n=1 Tax=Niallia endozanthoxylica TaxID=2036016 RepID=A0A5J5I6N2_9BACI|nr:hypothetical protein [Niallia endozanthoxylica]KAA9032432.1 hypothetical protein F4V44_00155 [Niallia endozanthoxylica]
MLSNTFKRAEEDLARAQKQQKIVFGICVIMTFYLVINLIVLQHILYLVLIPVAWSLYFLKIGFDKWSRRIIEERKEKDKDFL